jgi:hypothetical protein
VTRNLTATLNGLSLSAAAAVRPATSDFRSLVIASNAPMGHETDKRNNYVGTWPTQGKQHNRTAIT